MAAPKKTPKRLPRLRRNWKRPYPSEDAPAQQKSISLKPLKKKIVQEVKPPENQARKTRDSNEKTGKSLPKHSEKKNCCRKKPSSPRKPWRLNVSCSSRNRQPTMSRQHHRQCLSHQTQPRQLLLAAAPILLKVNILHAIFNRLHQFWTPPEYLQQKPNLTTVVVITINPDGSIANTLFESKSGDRVFDQFVSKTIETAAPMPPIPPALKKQRFEIGLRFRPGSIQ